MFCASRQSLSLSLSHPFFRTCQLRKLRGKYFDNYPRNADPGLASLAPFVIPLHEYNMYTCPLIESIQVLPFFFAQQPFARVIKIEFVARKYIYIYIYTYVFPARDIACLCVCACASWHVFIIVHFTLTSPRRQFVYIFEFASAIHQRSSIASLSGEMN